MKFDLEILNQYVKDGWVERNDHPSLPISIYNYSRKTQYEGKWDDITLKTRGLVLDNEGNVVAKAFDKFFNYEELVGNKWVESKIPNEPFEVFEKMDGLWVYCLITMTNGYWQPKVLSLLTKQSEVWKSLKNIDMKN